MTEPAAAGRQPAELQAATRRKADQAHARATAALARLRRSGDVVTFASVAREAGVSQRYLHSHDEFADQIRRLRPSLARQPLPPVTDTESGVVSVLRAKINAQQDKIGSLDEAIRRLKHDLEIAHGEIIKLRSQRRHDPS